MGGTPFGTSPLYMKPKGIYLGDITWEWGDFKYPIILYLSNNWVIWGP